MQGAKPGMEVVEGGEEERAGEGERRRETQPARRRRAKKLSSLAPVPGDEAIGKLPLASCSKPAAGPAAPSGTAATHRKQARGRRKSPLIGVAS